MKRLLSLTLTLVAGMAFAADGSIGFIWSPAAKELTPVVSKKISELNRPFGLREPLQLQGFLGLPTRGGPAVGGVAATLRYSVARELTVDFGPALLVENKTPKSVSIFVGATWRF